MDSSLQVFVRQLLSTAAVALLPVVLTAFLSIPYALQGHPAEPRSLDRAAAVHMT